MPEVRVIVSFLIVGMALFSGVAALPGNEPLPEAPIPQVQTAPAGQVANAVGNIADSNGDGISSARVELLHAEPTNSDPFFQGTTDPNGAYTLHQVPPGAYRIHVSAPGFRDAELSIQLRPSRITETLPTITLQLAATHADVEVTVTTEQIAAEQVHLQEQQRVLGIFPNFYTSFIWGAAPMSAKQKFGLAAHAKLDPVALATVAASAGFDQVAGRFKGYGDGPAGFGKRFGAAFATTTSGRFFAGAVYPALFHQDPRYFYSGRGSVRSRAIYALSRSVIARGDDGAWEPNYSNILGRFSSAALANAYLPAEDRTARITLSTAALSIGADAGANLVREFLLKRFTGHVPAFANGKPKDAQNPSPQH